MAKSRKSKKVTVAATAASEIKMLTFAPEAAEVSDFNADLSDFFAAELDTSYVDASTAEVQDFSDHDIVADDTSYVDVPVVAEEPKLIAAKGELGEMLTAVKPDSLETMMKSLGNELVARSEFEERKNASNVNIHKTLAKCNKSMVRYHVAALFAAAELSPSFINRVLQDGSHYNVYAIQKLADFADGLVGSGMSNAINIACMKSLFACKRAGIQFNGELAKASASDKIKIAESVNKHLVRHTVSASTAPTQASSTMQALQTLGAVKITGSRKNPIYEVVDGPIARRLEELCGFATATEGEELAA